MAPALPSTAGARLRRLSSGREFVTTQRSGRALLWDRFYRNQAEAAGPYGPGRQCLAGTASVHKSSNSRMRPAITASLTQTSRSPNCPCP